MNNNELIKPKSWWQLSKKWVLFVVVGGVVFIGSLLFSGVGSHITHLATAYSDANLYRGALQIAQKDQRVDTLLGVIEPIDKFAIIEGEARYTNDGNTVQSSVRINGSKRKAVIDIMATRENEIWNYTKITIRIKKPIEEKQRIEIIQ